MDNNELNSKIVRLETILETHLEKIVNGLDLLNVLKGETELNKKFRDGFRDNVKKMILEELNTVSYEVHLEEVNRKQIHIILESDEFNKLIDERAKAVVNKRLKDILLNGYVKLSLIILGILGSGITMYLKGWLGND